MKNKERIYKAIGATPWSNFTICSLFHNSQSQRGRFEMFIEMSNCQRMLNKEWNLKLFYSSLLFHSLTLVPLRELQWRGNWKIERKKMLQLSCDRPRMWGREVLLQNKLFRIQNYFFNSWNKVKTTNTQK